METAVGSFAIAGATLAQIMHEFGSCEGDCDGILFGRLQLQTSRMQDDDGAMPAAPQEQVTARVTGYFCSGRINSFYDSVGMLDHSKLSSIMTGRQSRGEDPIIGWFIGRRNTSMIPSMRETAVTAHLRSECSTAGAVAKDSKSTLVRSDSKSEQKPSGGDPPSTLDASGRKADLLAEDIHQPDRVSTRSMSLATSTVLDSALSPNKRNSNNSSPQKTQTEKAGTSRTPLPCCFLLLTESDFSDNAVRTHEYRAFQSLQRSRGFSFEPLPVTIVNAGVAMRSFYDSFVPVASVPSWFNLELSPDISGPSDLQSPGGRSISKKSETELEKNGLRGSGKANSDSVNLGLEKLDEGQGSVVASRVSRFESLYEQMLSRLEQLSSEAYDTSVAPTKSPVQRDPAAYQKS